jgi:thiamine-phosphate pyrophosphorylase
MKAFDLSLYLVTDSSLTKNRSLTWTIEEAIKGGVTMVQVREKNCSTFEFLQLAEKIKVITQFHHIPLIINDRVDIALAVDADGVHIGQSDMPYGIARKILGHAKIIGLSVETIEEAREANNLDVDYIGISPVFGTNTKLNIKTPLGLEGIRSISSFSKHSIVGIGGINPQNTPDILKAGANGVAVVSAIISAENPLIVSTEFTQTIHNFHCKTQIQ